MKEGGNHRRPVRVLEVENFSVIRKARLEFGRVTVLVGPQASGKSLLCKLTYFLGGEVIGIAVESLVNKNSWGEFLKTVAREFSSRFSTDGWLRKSCRVSFRSHRYSVALQGVGDPLNPTIEFSFDEDVRESYTRIERDRSRNLALAGSQADQIQEVWLQLSTLLNAQRTQASVYIPAGRALFVDPRRALSALQSPELDQITRQFAARIPWDPRWKAGMLTTGRGVLQEVEKEFYRLVRGAVAVVDGKAEFVTKDGRTLPLSLLSSGTSEMVPMFALLDYLAFYQEHFYARSASRQVQSEVEMTDYSPLIFLEEPEAHIFPDTQRDLVNLFAWMANDPILSFDWVITTHSPYILTAFNTLIEAWRAGKRTGKHNQVAEIVPEHSWISEDDFAAYTIQDGILKSIFERESKDVEGSGLIDGDYLDSVSEQLGREFEKLLDIEYAD